ncbi:MAG: GatB/YqeY domain-containing protein [Candidatus Doudnabacteria bacterium]|nr:GatB/YqeY domain-containing protein [Candidatus Doudnabacteria bacterium]
MVTLESIEQDLTASLKARDAVRTGVLRALKTRLQNEHIAQMKDLTEDQVTALIRSEVKRRKEAAEAFKTGGRTELADKEEQESAILAEYLPAGPSEQDILTEVEKVIADNGFTSKDFGQAMGKLKASLPNADGAELARILKEKLT